MRKPRLLTLSAGMRGKNAGFPANLYESLREAREPLESLLDGLQNTKRSSRASVQEEHVRIHAVRVLRVTGP